MKSKRNLSPMTGDADQQMRRLLSGNLNPTEMAHCVRRLNAMIPGSAVANHAGGLDKLQDLGVAVSPETQKLVMIQTGQAEKPKAPITLAEQARAAASMAIAKSSSPQLDANLLMVGRLRHPEPPKPTTSRARIRTANSKNDWRMAAEIFDTTPAVKRMALEATTLSGSFDNFRETRSTDKRVRDAATVAVAGEWAWNGEDEIAPSYAWLGVSLDEGAQPLVRKSSVLGTLHRSRLQLVDHAEGDARPIFVNQSAKISAESWFAADDSLLDLFGRSVGEIPLDAEGLALKPDEEADFEAFVAGKDALVAPSARLLVVTQEFARIRMQPYVPA